ncbi:hypothetical protein CTI12_AA027860 [Artemisia annua]|uniref:non-specific serine/threonine protein kinase n=1 Tax=Artemisia annua TaxID=35608 RepID=A0A2U1QEU9_ARTAN|nr:hypothetical protein CTI12_AA027860 [Artemisia annua]
MLGDGIGRKVFKGLDLENGNSVAIKQVSLENIAEKDLDMVMCEIDGALVNLRYVENGSLANMIKPRNFGPLPEPLVASYVAQVLEGLVYLHEQGVVHRDIKGANILTTKEMLGNEIGEGVFKGLENGNFVAIKQVSLENIADEDLNIIMNLNHKNVVKYLGSLETESHLHMILEYVDNDSLANMIEPNNFGPLPEPLVAFYIAQVLEGLVYLHEQGVIHRNIKGENLLISKETAMKLTEAKANRYSVDGPPYLDGNLIFLGCTVVELLTGLPPYHDVHAMRALFIISLDASLRPDAKTPLSHPWIQISRRVFEEPGENEALIEFMNHEYEQYALVSKPL